MTYHKGTRRVGRVTSSHHLGAESLTPNPRASEKTDITAREASPEDTDSPGRGLMGQEQRVNRFSNSNTASRAMPCR